MGNEASWLDYAAIAGLVMLLFSPVLLYLDFWYQTGKTFHWLSERNHIDWSDK